MINKRALIRALYGNYIAQGLTPSHALLIPGPVCGGPARGGESGVIPFWVYFHTEERALHI